MFRINVPDLPHRVVELIGHQDLTYRPAGMRDLEEYVLRFLKLEDTGGLERSPAKTAVPSKTAGLKTSNY